MPLASRNSQLATRDSLLRRIFGRVFAPAGPAADPVLFGPRYALTGDRLAIESGPLTGTALRIERSMSDTKADFALYEVSPLASLPVAHCHFDRDPETGTETLWDIFIRSDFRQRSLTTLLVPSPFANCWLRAGVTGSRCGS